MRDNRALRIAAVAHAGSLRGVAKLLEVAPSPVQRTLTAAERRVGCLLFEPGTTGARPTLVGRVVVQHAQERDDLDTQLSARLSSATSAAVVEVAIGIGPGFVDWFASRVLAPFMDEHHRVQVDIVTGGPVKWSLVCNETRSIRKMSRLVRCCPTGNILGTLMVSCATRTGHLA